MMTIVPLVVFTVVCCTAMAAHDRFICGVLTRQWTPRRYLKEKTVGTARPALSGRSVDFTQAYDPITYFFS